MTVLLPLGSKTVKYRSDRLKQRPGKWLRGDLSKLNDVDPQARRLMWSLASPSIPQTTPLM